MDFITFCNTYINLFAIISSIATAIAVLVGLVTLIEVKRQRESTYKPEIVILEDTFLIIKDSLPYKYKSDVESIDIEKLTFHLNCLNIGFASAKNVIFNFSIDTEKYIKIIKKYNNQINDEKIIIHSDKRSKVISIKSQNKLINNITFYKNNDDLKLNYFLPVNIKNEIIKVEIPTYMLYINSLLVYYNWKYKSLFYETYKFNLAISYVDIGDKKHLKNFEIQFDPIYMMESRSEFRIIIKQLN